MKPENELGVIVVFSRVCREHGWDIVRIGVEFPDATIQDEQGIEYLAEFEYRASSFRKHGHDLRQCDVIICWENDWPECFVTIWEMQDWNNPWIADEVRRKDREIAYLRSRNCDLEQRIAVLEGGPLEPKPDMRSLAKVLLETNPDITGSELGRMLGRSERMGRKLKQELAPSRGNGAVEGHDDR